MKSLRFLAGSDENERTNDDINLEPNSHLRLGITIQGMEEFLRRIGFYNTDAYVDSNRKIYSGAYADTYTRSDELAWATELHGPIERDGLRIRRSTVTGYDCVSAMKHWLRSHGKSHLSVCEVLLHEAPKGFEDLRNEVGPASVFYSHLQSRGIHDTLACVNSSCQTYARELFRSVRQALPEYSEDLLETEHMNSITFSRLRHRHWIGKWWVDFFSLRQCHNDFNVQSIRALIKEVGLTVAEVDWQLGTANGPARGGAWGPSRPIAVSTGDGMRYLKRSFCVYELYCTLEGRARLLCNMRGRVFDAFGGIVRQHVVRQHEIERGAELETYGNDGIAPAVGKSVGSSFRGMWAELRRFPVDAANTETLQLQDKLTIDDFIRSVGFRKFNGAITSAILEGADREDFESKDPSMYVFTHCCGDDAYQWHECCACCSCCWCCDGCCWCLTSSYDASGKRDGSLVFQRPGCKDLEHDSAFCCFIASRVTRAVVRARIAVAACWWAYGK